MTTTRLLCGYTPDTAAPPHDHGRRETMVHPDGARVHRGQLDGIAVVVIGGAPSVVGPGDPFLAWAEDIDATGGAEAEDMTPEQCALWAEETAGNLEA